MYFPFDVWYFAQTGQVFNQLQIQELFGINTDTASIEILNYLGLFPVIQSTPNPIDSLLYTVTPTYAVVGPNAIMSFSYVPLPLTTAQTIAENKVKTDTSTANQTIADQYGLNVVSFAGIASQEIIPASFQTVFDDFTANTNQLNDNLIAINSATSVDVIDSILKQPSGTFVSGRGGAGPLDMNPSYFSVLTDLPAGVDESDLEIYIPGTDTVIPYDPGLPAPYYFDSAGNCYTGTDYRTTFRVAATGQVLGTVTPAFGANVPIPWTYNPVIPSLGGGSSSSAR